MPSKTRSFILASSCFLKELESPSVYNVETDELYELGQEAFDFLQQCHGQQLLDRVVSPEARELVDFCLEEGILRPGPGPQGHRGVNPAKSKILRGPRSKGMLRPLGTPLIPGKRFSPSLRYLELQVTSRCNLRCRHCYLGDSRPVDLPLAEIAGVMKELEQMQGLRLLVSGGEPLLHPHFWELNELLPGLGFRSILLTNGTLLDDAAIARLNFQEVQISLDGMEATHDLLRGKGTFKKAWKALEDLRKRGRDVSVATMVHSANLQDFPVLKGLLSDAGVREWNIDVPSVAGRLQDNPELCVPYAQASRFLSYGYGGGLYSSSGNYACGAHLCTVTPEGKVAKCGFFATSPVGTIADGLEVCWGRLTPLYLKDLSCQCNYVEECRGGCRYRALTLTGSACAPDPVLCYSYGVLP